MAATVMKPFFQSEVASRMKQKRKNTYVEVEKYIIHEWKIASCYH
jgi:hypothetical protein